MDMVLTIILCAVGVAVGIAIGYFYRRNIAESKIGRAEEAVQNLIADAQKRAEVIKKETVLEAQEEVHKLRSELDKESRERRNEAAKTEKRLLQREEAIEKKLDNITLKEDQLAKKAKEIAKEKEDIVKEKENLSNITKQQIEQLERVSGMSRDEAKELLLEKVENEARHDMAAMVRDIETKAKDEADKKQDR